MVVILDVEKQIRADDPPAYDERDEPEESSTPPSARSSPKNKPCRRRKLSRRARIWLRLGYVVFLLIFIRVAILRRNEKDFEFLQRMIEDYPAGDENSFDCLSTALDHNKTEKLFLYVSYLMFIFASVSEYALGAYLHLRVPLTLHASTRRTRILQAR